MTDSAGQPDGGAERRDEDRPKRSAGLLGGASAPAESWDERPESDEQVRDRYLADRPPHHGD